MIVYATRTGNVRYIVSQLTADAIELTADLQVDVRYLLITYTDGLGNIPAKVEQFMKHNHNLCQGVVVSGNSNFGHHVFGGAGDKLSQMYHIPLVRKLDLRGNQKDYDAIQSFYESRVKG